MSIHDMHFCVSWDDTQMSSEESLEIRTLDMKGTRVRDDGIFIEGCHIDQINGTYHLISVIPSFGPHCTEDAIILDLIRFLGDHYFDQQDYRKFLKSISLLGDKNLIVGQDKDVLMSTSVLHPYARELNCHLSLQKAHITHNHTFGELYKNGSLMSNFTALTPLLLGAIYRAKTGYTRINRNIPSDRDFVGKVNQILSFAMQRYSPLHDIPLIYEDVHDRKLYVSYSDINDHTFAFMHSPLRKWWHLLNQLQLYPDYRQSKESLAEMVEMYSL